MDTHFSEFTIDERRVTAISPSPTLGGVIVEYTFGEKSEVRIAAEIGYIYAAPLVYVPVIPELAILERKPSFTTPR